MVGSPGLFATQDAENAAVPKSVVPALVGTFAQTVQSGNGMSAQDAQTRNLYGKIRLGVSANGMSPDSYQEAIQRWGIPLSSVPS